MKRKYLIVCFISFCLLFIGCAGGHAQRQNNYNQIMNSWMGHNVNELIRAWGPYTAVQTMPNGNRLFIWSKARTSRNPTITLPSTTTYNVYGNTLYQNNPMGMTIGGDVVTHYCNSSFEVNSSDTIVYWRWEGNACY